eukprot:CAMPEP_0202971776 /NCGR_PEP_ID=MMETSP1396-20130829/30741_1 /ASSEMBLY_ACC=CAM_ASM_000872 /TAXON_ID= /ORGANISM="Pseudokeronopsis sp., Strain Brazil" /LENGTH=455 /DNA_ID=CAMNT_0049701527 /DNA_START=21 /DNA_END=1388 /DNA_ORIENTATION=+
MADLDRDYDSEEEEVKVEEEPEPESPPEDATLNNPDVITKYQEASKIAQSVLLEVAARCVPGARIVDICRFGDEAIEARVANIFKSKGKNGKAVMKGIAFPVCVSVNDAVCHVSPLESDNSFPPLSPGDVAKIDLGVHIDGFIAVVAHTIVVPGEVTLSEGDVARRNNVISAAYAAAEVAVRLMKPGNTNSQVTAAIKEVADAFDVRPISGTLMHQMKQFVIDGNKMILLKEEPEHKVDSCTFEAGEVYAIDIAMSTGEGKPRETGARTTVYKRAVEKKYSLRNKSSRQFFNDVNKRFPTLPFSVRCFADETTARMGIRECVNHELLMPYPILNERADEFVGHVKVTVLLLPSGNTAQVTGLLPSTYISALRSLPPSVEGGAIPAPVTPETTDGLETKNSAGFPVANTLLYVLQSQRPVVSLSSEIVDLIQQAPLESKKKANKKKKSAATAAEAK